MGVKISIRSFATRRELDACRDLPLFEVSNPTATLRVYHTRIHIILILRYLLVGYLFGHGPYSCVMLGTQLFAFARRRRARDCPLGVVAALRR